MLVRGLFTSSKEGTIIIYISRVAIAASIFLNAVLGGKNNQTLSAAQWERKRLGKSNVVRYIDIIFWYDPEHCEQSWIKWCIINNAINAYDGIAEHYYSGIKKK